MGSMTDRNASSGRCRFRSSFGGNQHCADEVYHYGFCRFHFECYTRGEILANGQINEKLTDQVRRRTINFHAIVVPGEPYAGSPSESSDIGKPGDRESKNP
jgi:hypothetical protein